MGQDLKTIKQSVESLLVKERDKAADAAATSKAKSAHVSAFADLVVRALDDAKRKAVQFQTSEERLASIDNSIAEIRQAILNEVRELQQRSVFDSGRAAGLEDARVQAMAEMATAVEKDATISRIVEKITTGEIEATGKSRQRRAAGTRPESLKNIREAQQHIATEA